MGESAVYAIKITIVIAATMTFVAAILSLVGLLTSFLTNTVLAEIVGLISIYLPFQPSYLFAGLTSLITAFLAFLVAQKVYQLTTNAQKSA